MVGTRFAYLLVKDTSKDQGWRYGRQPITVRELSPADQSALLEIPDIGVGDGEVLIDEGSGLVLDLSQIRRLGPMRLRKAMSPGTRRSA